MSAELDKLYLTDQQSRLSLIGEERVEGFLFTMSQTCPHYMLSRAQPSRPTLYNPHLDQQPPGVQHS